LSKGSAPAARGPALHGDRRGIASAAAADARDARVLKTDKAA